MIRLAGFLLLTASSAIAQVGGVFECWSSTPTIPFIRAEGLAENVGDAVVTCSGGIPGVHSSADLTITGTTAFTSRLVSPPSLLTEAVLLIDDPASPSAVGSNLIQGEQVAANQITFKNIPIVLPGAGKFTWRVKNLRVDATGASGAAIHIRLDFSTGALVSPDLVIGFKAPGFLFSQQSATGASLSSFTFSAGAGSAITHRLQFQEEVTHTFRKRVAGTSVATPLAVSDQSTPAVDYGTESGFYDSQLPAATGLNAAGLATQGTRLTARFSNVPAGASIYVTTAPLPMSDAGSARLVQVDASGGGAFSAVPQTATADSGGGAVGIAPVLLTNGTGTATWEVLESDSVNALSSYTFGVVVVAGQPGTAKVNGAFGPISAAHFGDATSPIPRFVDTSASQDACAASPCLTASPGAISISYRTADPAPAPISVQVGSTGASLPFSATAATTPESWLTVTPSSGATPAAATVTVSPENLQPGIHQANVVFSTGGQTTLLPVLVNVSLGPTGYLPPSCEINVPNFTQGRLRAESTSDLIADVVFYCSGGTITASGATVGNIDVKLTLPLAITNRVYGSGWSDALLLIDEPNSGSASAPQRACNNPSGLCSITGTGTGLGVYDGSPGRPNVFAGKVSGNTVTFSIPLDGINGDYVRVLRITNVRADATAVTLEGGTAAIVGTVSAGPYLLSNPNPTVANVFQGLSATLRAPDDTGASNGAVFSQCAAAVPQRAGVLRFGEGFVSAFRGRTAGGFVDANTAPVLVPQNFPGLFDGGMESGFYAPALTSQVADFTTVGLSNFGTRLRARIDNIPAGTRIFVSTQRIAFTNGTAGVPSNGVIARLITNELLPFAATAATTTLDGIPATELTVANGSASAVWEVLRGNPSAADDFDFLVWVQTGAGSATPATVTASFAPTPPFPTLPLPRFGAPNSAAQALFSASCPAQLSVAKSHTGNFSQGQTGATYTITVSNSSGAGPTSGAVSVTESVPSGLTLTGLSGTGWTCPAGTTACSRADSLAPGGNYPALTATVNVAPDAPASLINSVTVSGGGSGSATANDSTTILAMSAVTLATSPAGRSLTVDGNTITAPQTFYWVPGSSHAVSASSPQGSGGTRFVFASWSDAGAVSHSVTAATGTLTATFTTQYLLTLGVSPANSGILVPTPSSADGYYNAGTVVSLLPTPNGNNGFWVFTGDLTGHANPQSVTMNVPHSITANFALPPTPVSVTPASGTGATQTFSAVYSNPTGYADIQWIQMLFAVATDGGGQAYCFVHYDVQGNGFWLYGDGGFFVGPVAPGTLSNRLQNSLCALNTSGSSVTGTGTTLTVNANLVFKQAGARNIYMRAMNLGQADTGWVQRGTWNHLTAAEGTMSLTPSTGSGTTQTFSLTYPDPPGFAGAAFGWVQFLVAAATDGGGQPFCFVHYDRGGNGLWMYSSDVGFFLGPVTPGTASNALSSSACSVNTAAATVSNTGGNLVVTLPITMKAPMSGAKKTFQRTLDVLNRDTGWQQTGTWTVQ